MRFEFNDPEYERLTRERNAAAIRELKEMQKFAEADAAMPSEEVCIQMSAEERERLDKELEAIAVAQATAIEGLANLIVR